MAWQYVIVLILLLSIMAVAMVTRHRRKKMWAMKHLGSMVIYLNHGMCYIHGRHTYKILSFQDYQDFQDLYTDFYTEY